MRRTIIAAIVFVLRVAAAIAVAYGTFRICWTLFWEQVGHSGFWTVMAFIYPAWVPVFVSVAIIAAVCVLVFSQRFQPKAGAADNASSNGLPDEG
jgi:hypothetical protein